MPRFAAASLALAVSLGLAACQTTQDEGINIGGWEGTPQQWAQFGQAVQRTADTRLEGGWRVDCVVSDERLDTVRCFAAITTPQSSNILHISFYNDEGPVVDLRNGSLRINGLDLRVDDGPDIGDLSGAEIVDHMRSGEVLTVRYLFSSISRTPSERTTQYDVSAFEEAFQRLEEIRNDPNYDAMRLPGLN
jgi:hypothetical protein